jgi:hypothetical protein
VIETADNIERLRLGRMCANCREPFPIPWPRTCPLCGVYVWEQQADFFERMYGGEVDLRGGFDRDEEIERMREELARQEREAS